jgi:hypothetical protein
MADQKRRVIQKLKLDDIAKAVAKTEKWTRTQRDDAVRGYHAYLWLRLQHDQGRGLFLAIDKNSDKIWHAHIISTVQYQRDCDRIFGRYLDHTPFPHPVLTASQQRRFDKDQEEYAAECKTWGRAAMIPWSIPICG